jgi:outer membrane biosynthesis protein TonB
MKAGLTTSLIFHTAVIAFAVLSLSAPPKFEVASIESLPVDIIPVKDFTKIAKGDKKAAMAERPAPKPTERPDIVKDAINTGDNKVDLKNAPTPDPNPREVQKTATPPPAPKPETVAKPDPSPKPSEAAKANPVPATEVAAESQPKQDVAPDPAPQTAATSNPDAKALDLPETAPKPESRPKPPQAQTAKAPDHKDSKKPEPEKTASVSSDAKEFNADDIAALLNREKPSGGGAKRSQDVASLGGESNSQATQLSQSELDSLRGQIQKCWNVTYAGAEGADTLKVSIKMHLDPSGAIEGAPQIVAGGGQDTLRRIASEAARRAVLRCAPYKLPLDKYDAWSEVLVHFDPSNMF